MARAFRVGAWLLVAALPAAAEPARLTVGALSLQRCPPAGAYCGRLERPLDPSGRVAGTIGIHFEFYPATGAARTGTVVAADGGPGYPATGSRTAYLALLGSLRADHDLLLMDNRGTGRSGAVDCTRLQQAPLLSIADIGACGRALGAAAPLYGTAHAADDLDAILGLLALGPVDLYGNSYGTFFAQVFAVRHPDRLRSLVLDGAYPLDAPDLAWYPAYAPAVRSKLNLSCARSPSCAAVPGSSLEHLAPALAELRRRPRRARSFDADGVVQEFTADATALALVLFGSAPPFATLREADAAAQAYARGDPAPLWRLMAEAQSAVDSRDPSHDPAQFSQGLAMAVTCGDTPQIFDMGLPPAQRRADRERVLALRRSQAPDTYAPFAIDEFRGMVPDYSFIDECIDWPAQQPDRPPAYIAARAQGFPPLPVLVLSGEFDNMTSAVDGDLAARQFSNARHVVLANSLHVNALPQARSPCGAGLVRRFLATLDPGDTGCAQAVPPLRLAPPFARHYRDVPAATALAGNSVDRRALSAAAAALATTGDLLGRLEANGSGRGRGLRGGSFSVAAQGSRLRATLARVRWTEDLDVSGTLEVEPGGGAGEATLRFRDRGGLEGTLVASWPAGGPEARARLVGQSGGLALAAETAAP